MDLNHLLVQIHFLNLRVTHDKKLLMENVLSTDAFYTELSVLVFQHLILGVFRKDFEKFWFCLNYMKLLWQATIFDLLP